MHKLGTIPNLFYRIIQLLARLKDSQTPLSDLIEKKIYASEMTFLKLQELMALLKSIKGVSLGEYIEEIFEKYDSSNNNHFRQLVKRLMNLDRYSYQDFINYLLDELFLNIGFERMSDFKLQLREFFNEEYLPKINKSDIGMVKQSLEALLDERLFSYIDMEEALNLKRSLYQLVDSYKDSTFNNEEKESFKMKLDKLFDDEIFSYIDVDEVDIAKKKLEELLSVQIDQWILWYEFINDEQQSDIVYHTYHGTKGAEFDNVIILMQNDFGRRNKDKFSSFFRHYKDPTVLGEEEMIKFNNTKNLLYVSCSRAIKNLRILYLDDVSEFKHGIESIFGRVFQF